MDDWGEDKGEDETGVVVVGRDEGRETVESRDGTVVSSHKPLVLQWVSNLESLKLRFLHIEISLSSLWNFSVMYHVIYIIWWGLR